ncbi:alkylhydroperoxidase domain protein [Nesterenkonia flava]|uniref:Alkylhydroperoxidase domain protein n=1 Tax=Nesterenkonia flava TaxID=469799 RepID=A0ABU1FRF7_9MICC|nr:alkylhydroperoxidase domain protein [Nesterenkonia flava]MDR5711203.1 alkylhydroperoxidase domain protein [Nesterenkonia flava]
MNTVLEYQDITRPEGFTQQGLGWRPWLAPVPEDELTEAQRAALLDDFRIKSPYFRLLVRNPQALHARTLTDKDIFYNVTSGLPRADREIAASAASRLNGCVYCASVHTARATAESGRAEDVQRLLDEGVDADLGEPWSAIAAASAALTRTPSAFGRAHLQALRQAGLGEGEILDVIYGASFFNWANRLMLSLGEPEVPPRRR